MDGSELRGPGDYGYDMAHEDMARQDMTRQDMARQDRARQDRSPGEPDRPEHPGPSPRRSDTDRGEDLAYDEAHDF